MASVTKTIVLCDLHNLPRSIFVLASRLLLVRDPMLRT
jgi:hypothetical protein